MDRLPSTATALGLFASLQHEVGQTDFEIGDALLLFSDGVVEAVRGGADELGEARLADLFRDLTGKGATVPEIPKALIREILQVSDFRQTDDMTVVVARRG